MSLRSLARTFYVLSHTPINGRAPIPPSSPFFGTPLTTFRSYAGQASPAESKDTQDSHDQSGPQAPSTDEIAQSDAAFDGSTTNPNQAKSDVEGETSSGSMDTSAANAKASEPPQEQRPLQTSKSDAQKSDTSNH